MTPPEAPTRASSGSRDPRPAARATSDRNSIPASQARAARRREARRDEQAVAAWLRELAVRGR